MPRGPALAAGNIIKANSYLGYKFTLSGTVIKGKNLGSQIGFPTANISIQESYKLIPKNGSYVVKVKVSENTFFGMMNIGENPTIAEKGSSIEVHLFDFQDDIYGQSIKIQLIDRLRDEQKFTSVEELKKQLEKDRETSLKIIGTHYD